MKCRAGNLKYATRLRSFFARPGGRIPCWRDGGDFLATAFVAAGPSDVSPLTSFGKKNSHLISDKKQQCSNYFIFFNRINNGLLIS